MNKNEMLALMVKLDEAVGKALVLHRQLADIHTLMQGLLPGVPRDEPEPGGDPKEWKWEGEIGVQPEVLGTFPAGDYEFRIFVDVPRSSIGKQKDFRVLLIDRLNLGRGKDPEDQFHVENGLSESRLYLGGHPHLGGAGWPGNHLDSESVKVMEEASFDQDLWDLVKEYPVHIQINSEFALVLGELVTHDRGRVTSPAGTRYEITMRKVG